MSILSTFALFVTAIVRPKLDPWDHEIIALKTQINDLERERNDARIEADRWHAVACQWEQRVQARQSPEAIAQQQQQALLMSQYTQAQQQYAQMQIAAQNLSPLGQQFGMQNLQVPQSFDELWCNCVPARHDLLRPR
jgi:hypothetical protein